MMLFVCFPILEFALAGLQKFSANERINEKMTQ